MPAARGGVFGANERADELLAVAVADTSLVGAVEEMAVSLQAAAAAASAAIATPLRSLRSIPVPPDVYLLICVTQPPRGWLQRRPLMPQPDPPALVDFSYVLPAVR